MLTVGCEVNDIVYAQILPDCGRNIRICFQLSHCVVTLTDNMHAGAHVLVGWGTRFRSNNTNKKNLLQRIFKYSFRTIYNLLVSK